MKLLLDATGLMHRSYHAMKTAGLAHNRIKTGMLFGFVRDVVGFMDQYQTREVALCFDAGESKRKLVNASYKADRLEAFKKMSKEDQDAKLAMLKQIAEFRDELLPSVGFQVFSADGYEADDIIASIVANHAEQSLIISDDTDLYQLLREGVAIYRPRLALTMTKRDFLIRYQIEPSLWPVVNVLTGGHNGLPGIPGVGEITALTYCSGGYLPEMRRRQIKSWYTAHGEKDLPLCKLPYEGCPSFHMASTDRVTKQTWQEFCKEYGLTSLLGAHPACVN